jgi:Histidine kinase-, DNA gyrase B-, and HSP90-like ATPase
MANAIAYNEPGGWVEAEVAVADQPALAVRNTGQHIPAEDVTSLFEPFRRLGADRTSNSGGAGLDLSIVRSITAAHQGTVHARPRPDGGLTIELEFPDPTGKDSCIRRYSRARVASRPQLTAGCGAAHARTCAGTQRLRLLSVTGLPGPSALGWQSPRLLIDRTAWPRPCCAAATRPCPQMSGLAAGCAPVRYVGTSCR